MTGGPRASDLGRWVVVALAVVVGLLLAAVAWKYWPAWVLDLGGDLVDAAARRAQRTWKEVGGRWIMLGVLVLSVGGGLLVARRNRWLGYALAEVGLAACAIVLLLQPAGW